MNIFILDKIPSKNAEYHVDKHVVKMILEHAQLLSTASRYAGLEQGYNITHLNHPCNKWARESIDNWCYLYRLTEALHTEWQYRYKHIKEHKSWSIVKNFKKPNLPEKGLTQFAMAMPDKYKSDDIVESYRNYYINEKRHIASWKNRDIPYWWK